MDLMNGHIDKAEHNEFLHATLCENEPNNLFGWKIVALFYSALHYLKALGAKRSIDIGDTHFDIDGSCNPYRNDPIMPITKEAWAHYKHLLNYSKDSRYNVSIDLERKDHENCISEFNQFKRYIKSQDVPINVFSSSIKEIIELRSRR